MFVYLKNLILLLFAISFLLSGCAGQTKPYIPTDISHLKDDQARIILTREKQIAGAISTVIFIDVGKDIDPNSFIYINNLEIEDLTKKNENINSFAGFPVGFMWFNPNLVNPLYCGNHEPGCIKYNNNSWPRKNISNTLSGTATLVALDENNNEIKNFLHYAGNHNITKFRTPDNRILPQNTQVIGSTEVGDTLIWDRQPGIMRLGAVWHDGVGFMPKNIHVEPGKTYFVHYTTRLGQRWELKAIE